jgi:Flp pilus assembly protein TadG
MSSKRLIPDSTQRGVIILWVAFFLLVMMFFVALAVDGAKLTATRIQLQNAADAAALSGASAIDTLAGAQGQIVHSVATARAQQNGLLNRAYVAGEEPVSIAVADITFPQPNQCQVVVRRQAGLGTGIITTFAHLVGHPTLDMTATATAELSPVNKACDKLVPMGAIPPTGQQFQVGCQYVYDLKVGSGSSTQGNYQLLSFPQCAEGPCAGMPSTGANTMACLVANGYGCCIQIGQSLQTEPGNKVGPFRQAVQDRWDADTDRRETICYRDYHGNGERVVFVPKIGPLGNGRTDVTVTGFTAFFLRQRPTGGGGGSILKAEFLYNVVPGGSGGGQAPAGTTLFTLRLVK